MFVVIGVVALFVILALATGGDMLDERDKRDAVSALYRDVYKRDD